MVKDPMETRRRKTVFRKVRFLLRKFNIRAFILLKDEAGNTYGLRTHGDYPPANMVWLDLPNWNMWECQLMLSVAGSATSSHDNR